MDVQGEQEIPFVEGYAPFELVCQVAGARAMAETSDVESGTTAARHNCAHCLWSDGGGRQEISSKNLRVVWSNRVSLAAGVTQRRQHVT